MESQRDSVVTKGGSLVRVQTLRTWVSRALFPHFCVGCNKEGVILCTKCNEYKKASIRGLFRCPGCGVVTPGGVTCDKLACSENYIDGCVSMASYGDKVLHDLLHAYKYDGVFEARDQLLSLFGMFVDKHKLALSNTSENSAVIPVPMHAVRERYRGYNQARDIARVFAERMSLSVYEGSIGKRFSLSSQVSLGDTSIRMDGIKNQIYQVGKVAPPAITLIDDVYTTGATLNECAKALKSMGATRVYGVTLLRG